jgi:Tfp pilus assembly protein PilO
MLLGIAAALLVVGFWFFVLSPQRKAAADAKAKLVTAQQAFSAAQLKVTSGRNAQTAFRRDRTTIVKLGRVVPETDDIPTLITQLQTLAAKEKVIFVKYNLDSGGIGSTSASSTVAGTTPTNTVGTQVGDSSTATVAPLFPPGSVSISGGLGRTPIALELQGSYFELQNYLRSVQRFAVLAQKRSTTNGRLMVVDGFSYEFAPDKDKAKYKNAELLQPKLKATLSASVYFAPPIDTPSASAGASGTTPSTASSGSTSTGTAAIGGLQ